MNNKGFTLIELLATIVIISIVTSRATIGVISAINTSKKNSEKIFTDKLATAIESYLSLNGSTINKTNQEYQFKKCRKIDIDGNCIYKPGESQKQVKAYELESIHLLTITEDSTTTITKDKVVNPANKKNCLENQNPSIKLYKDEDYVYYYYLDLRGDNTSCNISDDNAIINNIPKKLCESINTPEKELECDK